MAHHFDIIIIGSGIVGATAALALAKNPAWRIAIIDAKNIAFDWQSEKYDFRVSALSLAAKTIFQNLNVWDNMLAKRVSAYTHMHVWDATGVGKLDFDCRDVNENALGYIVEDQVTRVSLYEALQLHSNVEFVFPVELTELTEKQNGVELSASDGRNFSAHLLIAADGASSWVRSQLRIPFTLHDYHHTAIVTTVKTEKPHQATARQRFIATGPLAFLPLDDARTSSIVWSTTPDHAAELLQHDDEMFKQKISEAFAYHLGEVMSVEKRYHFPLYMRHVKQYVKANIALIGDAAHTLHPLAGQGVNLGLFDAVALSEVVSTASKKNRDYASFATLRRYERWRKSDVLAMLLMVDGLKKLFVNENSAIQSLRNTAVSFVNQQRWLKQFFANYAMGKRGDLPVLSKK